MSSVNYIYFTDRFSTCLTEYGITTRKITFYWDVRHLDILKKIGFRTGNDIVVLKMNLEGFNEFFSEETVSFLKNFQNLYYNNYTVFWLVRRILSAQLNPSKVKLAAKTFLHLQEVLNFSLLKHPPERLKTKSFKTILPWIYDRLRFWRTLLANSDHIQRKIHMELPLEKKQTIVFKFTYVYPFSPEFGVLFDLYDEGVSKEIRELISRYYLERATDFYDFFQTVRGLFRQI